MKKLTAVLLALLLAFTLAACKGASESENTTQATTAESTATVPATAPKAEVEPVTNGDGDVLITLPHDLVGDESGSELTAEQKEKGIKKAIVNDDGTLTYVIDKDKYASVKDSVYKEVGDTLNNYKTARDYIKNVASKDDFSVINLQVDSEEFSSQMDGFAIVWEVGLYGELYQAFSGVQPDGLSVDVIVTDYSSGEVINAAHYPGD